MDGDCTRADKGTNNERVFEGFLTRGEVKGSRTFWFFFSPQRFNEKFPTRTQKSSASPITHQTRADVPLMTVVYSHHFISGFTEGDNFLVLAVLPPLLGEKFSRKGMFLSTNV